MMATDTITISATAVITWIVFDGFISPFFLEDKIITLYQVIIYLSFLASYTT